MSGARTYLDYNATAPLLASAREAMIAALEVYGNPSSVHVEGRAARQIVERAREDVSRLVGAAPSQVVFTSGATEANAWVIAGGWERMLLARTEHVSVLEPARKAGCPLDELPVGGDGVIDLADLERRLSPTRGSARSLLSLQLANNETGVIQPVGAAAELARRAGVMTHTDATQAAGRCACDFVSLDVDFMSLSSHKIGGPKGVGALVVRDGVELAPLVPGGGQERRRRGGTENVAAIAGFGAAAREALARRETWSRVARLRDGLEAKLTRLFPASAVIGSRSARLPNTTAFAWPGHAAETLVIRLDLAGISVSAGSACSSGKVGASHVLSAMGLEPEIARSTIRISLGPASDEADIGALIEAMRAIAGSAQSSRGTRATLGPAQRQEIEMSVGEV